jgi:hypothetical protein
MAGWTNGWLMMMIPEEASVTSSSLPLVVVIDPFWDVLRVTETKQAKIGPICDILSGEAKVIER